MRFGLRARVGASAVLGALLLSLAAFGAEPQEGKDYTLVPAAALPRPAAKISVVEFFSYQCPHCFAFSKPLREWSRTLPTDVEFARYSVSIGHAPWRDIARSYYALQAMGILDSLDADIFDAIHQHGVHLENSGYIMGWLQQRGVDIEAFDKLYRAADVRGAFEHGEDLVAQYKIAGIPTMVIDGKYAVAIASNRPFEPQLAVVEYLIQRARSERTK